MKKLISALLVVSMILLLASCGSTEPTTATYRTEMEQNGLVMVDTMTIDAKGDSIEKMTEIIEMERLNNFILLTMLWQSSTILQKVWNAPLNLVTNPIR